MGVARVLCARPSGAEAQLLFVALIDLFDGVDKGALQVPGPQRAALEVALLRAEPTGAPPPPRAIALSLLNALRTLAGGERLVVAIDDVQSLDPPSADASAFAVRRLVGESVMFLLARRPGSRSRWGARWPSAGCRRSARTFRSPMRSRTCSACAWRGCRALYGMTRPGSPSTGRVLDSELLGRWLVPRGAYGCLSRR